MPAVMRRARFGLFERRAFKFDAGINHNWLCRGEVEPIGGRGDQRPSGWLRRENGFRRWCEFSESKGRADGGAEEDGGCERDFLASLHPEHKTIRRRWAASTRDVIQRGGRSWGRCGRRGGRESSRRARQWRCGAERLGRRSL